MAVIDKNKNEIIRAWQELIEQSIKANTAFLEDSSKIFSSLLSKKIETKDLLKINTEVLNAAANNFIKLNIANTENLMNFGINISRGFFSFTKNEEKETATDSDFQDTASSVTETRSRISISVKQGEKITTSFYLNSHSAFAQSGKYISGDFIHETTGESAAISMYITPKEFILKPGKSVKTDISIEASTGVTPGKYKSVVKLEGMDNKEFDIAVEVIENKLSPSKTLKPKRIVKKSVAKKTVKKAVARNRKKK